WRSDALNGIGALHKRWMVVELYLGSCASNGFTARFEFLFGGVGGAVAREEFLRGTIRTGGQGRIANTRNISHCGVHDRVHAGYQIVSARGEWDWGECFVLRDPGSAEGRIWRPSMGCKCVFASTAKVMPTPFRARLECADRFVSPGFKPRPEGRGQQI